MVSTSALAAQAASCPLTVGYRPTASLVPDPRNARTHPKKQVAQIVASIREFGFTNPILADPEGHLIAGHGRLLAAKELGLTEVPVIALAGLSEAQKRALRLADNKIALNAGWDMEILKLELGELSLPGIDIDLGLTGFASGEIDVILAGTPDPEDEVIPAVPKTPRTQAGDIWQLGEHRIGCGDGRDEAFLRAVVGPGAAIDAAFLDPPYNVKINGHVNAKGRHREFAMASGEMTTSAFRTFLGETLGACAAVSRAGAVHFVCMDWRHLDDVSAAAGPIYDELLNICVWNKSNAGMGSLYRSKHEMVFVYRVPGAPHTNAVELGKHGRRCNSEAMSMHLEEVAFHIAPGAHAVVLLDQAGWHGSTELVVPANITLMPLPPRCPELNPVENVWQFMRDNWLSNRIFKSYDDIVDQCCFAWNRLVDQPWRIMSIGMRQWAHGF